MIIENSGFHNCTLLNLSSILSCYVLFVELSSLVDDSKVTLGPESFFLLKKIRRAGVDDKVFSLFYRRRNYFPSVINMK